MPRPTLTLEEVMSRTEADGECLLWTRRRSPCGYGVCKYKGRVWFVHRLVWFLTEGEEPGEMKVCHTCDRPPCIRREHLFLGTQADNLADARAKGRLVGKSAPWSARRRSAEERTPQQRYRGKFIKESVHAHD